LGAIVTHAVVTSDGDYILAAESGNVMYWSVMDKSVVFKEEQKDILQAKKSANSNPRKISGFSLP